MCVKKLGTKRQKKKKMFSCFIANESLSNKQNVLDILIYREQLYMIGTVSNRMIHVTGMLKSVPIHCEERKGD